MVIYKVIAYEKWSLRKSSRYTNFPEPIANVVVPIQQNNFRYPIKDHSDNEASVQSVPHVDCNLPPLFCVSVTKV